MIEIEFIPVGEETKTGDAILCRFTEASTGIDRVVLIDGGFRDTAADIAAHVDKYYGTSIIDLVVCTHPDADHIGGLFGVLDLLHVNTLVIHRPKDHGFYSENVKADVVDDLIDLARSKNTEVVTDAFAGRTFFGDSLMVAGPTIEFYRQMLLEQPAPDASKKASYATLAHSAGQAQVALAADPGEGELTDNGGDTPRNNSSIILDVQVDGYRALFTGDAGAPALHGAVDNLIAAGRSLSWPDFFDVPHHGSRHSLTSGVLDRLIGPIVGDMAAYTAFVSVGAKAQDHPRPEVSNAIKRRGYKVVATRGKTIRGGRKMQARPGWSPTSAMPWLDPQE